MHPRRPGLPPATTARKSGRLEGDAHQPKSWRVWFPSDKATDRGNFCVGVVLALAVSVPLWTMVAWLALAVLG
jgi:hypothetical protein